MSTSENNDFVYLESYKELFDARMNNPLHLCDNIEPMIIRRIDGNVKIPMLVNKGQSLIRYDVPNSIRITIQRSGRSIKYLNSKMEPMPELFDEISKKEIARLISFLPYNCGLDGMIISDNAIDYDDLKDDIRGRRVREDARLSLRYIITDIVTPRNITLLQRMDALSHMYSEYVRDFGESKVFSITESTIINNTRDLTDYLYRNNCEFCILGNCNSLYESSDDVVKIKNKSYNPNIRIELRVIRSPIKFLINLTEEQKLKVVIQSKVDERNYCQSTRRDMLNERLIMIKRYRREQYEEATRRIKTLREDKRIAIKQRSKPTTEHEIRIEHRMKVIEHIQFTTIELSKISAELDNVIHEAMYPGDLNQLVFMEYKDWDSFYDEYMDARDHNISNILNLNHLLKTMCNKALFDSSISDEDFNDITSIRCQRDQEVKRLASVSRYFSLHIINPHILTSESITLEGWMIGECYKIVHGISIYASSREMAILKACNTEVMTQQDIDCLADYLKSPDSPINDEQMELYIPTIPFTD